jgi:hypothetical protein
MKRLLLVLLVGLVGCEAAHREREQLEGDGGIDPPPLTCGAVTCGDVPAPTCVDATTLREYTAACSDGACTYPSTDTTCGDAGCCGDHCCEVALSNGDVVGPIQLTGLSVAPPNGSFDTDLECTASSALGACSVVARANLPEACVCRMDELSIGSLEVKGSRALVILAYETVRIQTILDVSGNPGMPGPGAVWHYQDPAQLGGGAGGSFATAGSSGGNGAAPAATYGGAPLIPLLGGMSGQGGGRGGGGGGGALQITAGVRIDVVGLINAGGGGGEGGYATYSISGGGGGGSGGGILLEAPKVVMTGRLNANGGGGGGGGGDRGWGAAGEDAYDDFASGGQGNDGSGCPLYGYVYGGDGGNGATRTSTPSSGQSSDHDSRCIGNPSFVGGGGGGGGLGRIRINTLTGCQCSGITSPTVSFGTLGVH